MKVFIIILNYKNTEATLTCIKSFYKHDKHFSEIVLVNNDPDDFDKKLLKNYDVHVINNHANLGFAAGVNIGIKYALSQKADAVLLINNDTMLEGAIIPKLAEVLKHEKSAGITGPAIEFQKDGTKVFDLGGDVNVLFGRTHHTEVASIFDVTTRRTTYISGCCVLIKAEVFKKVGFFDEQFFLYYEDVDFALRARAKGFVSFVVPSAVIHHELSKTTGKVSPFAVYHQTKSGVQFGKKYCRIVLLNKLFLFLQSLKIYLKSKKAGAAAFKALFGKE